MTNPDYSIVIPAYNESARIIPTLDRVLAYIQQQGWEAEIVVVNDGSRDDTAELVRDYAGGSAACPPGGKPREPRQRLFGAEWDSARQGRGGAVYRCRSLLAD